MTGEARLEACFVVRGGPAVIGDAVRGRELEPTEGEGEDVLTFFCSFSLEPFPIPNVLLINALNPVCGDLMGVLGEFTMGEGALV